IACAARSRDLVMTDFSGSPTFFAIRASNATPLESCNVSATPIAPRKAGPEWASRVAPGVPRGSVAAQDERAPRKPRRGRSAYARFVTKRSAGLLMYRARGSALEVLLVHPGGPFFRNKDAGVWTIPKGEPEP